MTNRLPMIKFFRQIRQNLIMESTMNLLVPKKGFLIFFFANKDEPQYSINYTAALGAVCL
jgi:hypothetical protein